MSAQSSSSLPLEAATVPPHTAHTSAAPAYDHAAAVARLEGDEAFLRELADLFIQDCPGWLTGIEAALNGGDAAAAQRLAHTLKGAAYHFAAGPTIAAAQALEQAADGGDLTGARAMFSGLARAVARLLGQLNTLLGRAPAEEAAGRPH
jgi:HPt (histidine-containing phosphotransfer) domain-containing protein